MKGAGAHKSVSSTRGHEYGDACRNRPHGISIDRMGGAQASAAPTLVLNELVRSRSCYCSDILKCGTKSAKWKKLAYAIGVLLSTGLSYLSSIDTNG